MKNILPLLALLLFCQFALGQTGKTGPEQNCIGAIPICQPIYNQYNSYIGPGTINPEFSDTFSCLKNGKNNAVWYTFTTTDAGIIQFSLTPFNSTNDYDFALFNITGYTCADILPMTEQLEVRCNYTLNDTIVGDSTGIGWDGYGASSPASGPAFNWPDTVGHTPQTFVLLVNNFTSGGFGYTLDFSGTTAPFGDVSLQYITQGDSEFFCPGITNITIPLSISVSCSSITSACCKVNGLSGVTVTQVQPVSCVDSTTGSILVQFSDTLPQGDFNILIYDTTLEYASCVHLINSIDTLHVRILSPHLGFSITLNQDTAFITDSSNYANGSFYFEISSPSGFNNYYADTVSYIALPTVGDYELCQYPYINPCYVAAFCQNFSYTGISSAPAINQITLTPNPTAGIVHLQLPNTNSITNLQVYNILGMLLTEQQIQPGSTSADIDLSNEAAGTYLLKLRQGNEQCMKKVVKY